MTQAPITQPPITSPTRAPRPCLELGVCQNRRPACADCEVRPVILAPGVIDGPYRRETLADRAHQEAKNAVKSAKDALRLVTAYLMGPHP